MEARGPAAKRPRHRSRLNHTLTEEQYQDVMECGCVDAHGTREENTAYASSWPLRGICPFYSIRGFFCFHGVSGDVGGSCNRRHLPWSSLSPVEQDQIETFVADSDGLMSLAVDY